MPHLVPTAFQSAVTFCTSQPAAEEEKSCGHEICKDVARCRNEFEGGAMEPVDLTTESACTEEAE